MVAGLNKKFRYKLEDFLSGKDVWDKYVFLRESQWWTAEQIEEYKLEKFRRLVMHCYRNVPAYTSLIKQSGLDPSNVRSRDDIKQLPVITKQYILDHYSDFVSTDNNSGKRIIRRKTSGTTGQVLEVMKDAESRSMVWGSFMRFKDWMGWDFKSRYIVFHGRNFKDNSLVTKLKIKFIDAIENSTTLDSYTLGESEIQTLIKLLDRYPKAILRGYVLNIVDIATILKSMGLHFSLQAISTTAEPLLDFHRKIIKDTFNCGVFDQYGCGEVGGVAYECDQHKGLHITEEHVILETDANDEILLTDLDNYIFPFLRYKNGDQAILSGRNCTCGRQSGMIKELKGRTSDNVKGLDGIPVHWGYFHHLLIYTKIATDRNMIKFQVIQESLSNLTINIQSDLLSQSEKNLLKKLVREKFGQINVDINNVDDIPKDKSGKFRAIISKI
ncbi:MAG: phenylacetate--CoA ligase family protein [Bacteroidia bacterium]|nr:MAG: phenylacetate--CoA ligase family protein [Bacteroidia bacterium]